MSNTITVSNAAELRVALASASGGDTIKLAAGNYGDLTLIDGKKGVDVSFASNVTITSADPGNPAVITGLDLRNAENITFKDITFDYTFEAGDPLSSRPFSVQGSENVTFAGCTFDGDLAQGVSATADGYGYGIGLWVRNSSDVTVTDSEFFDFWKGAVFLEVDGLEVSENDIHSLRSDGLNFAQVTQVLIENNVIHDFSTSPNSADHADMIQFWTNGTTSPSTDITIRGNHLDVGDGTATQSIFMRNDQVDQGLAGSEMFYRDVLIENNVIVNAHSHGISVGETNGLTIINNSVLHDDGGNVDGADTGVEIPRINVNGDSLNVNISGNLTSAITGALSQPGWVVTGNVMVQDQNPDAPGYYGDLFIASSYTGVDGLHHFRILPDQLIALTGIGAAQTTSGAGAGLEVSFQVTQPETGALQTRIFDAGMSTFNGGTLPQGTLYLWTFGDGTTAVGRTVSHTFAEGGSYDALLTVILPGGTTAQNDATVQVLDSTILRLDDDGRFVVSSMGIDSLLTASKMADAEGLHLGATGTTVNVDRTHLAGLFSNDAFEISLSLAADSGQSAGEVFRIHGSIIATVDKTGAFVVTATSDGGQTLTLSSGALKITDLAEHDIAIRLEDGQLQLWIDGGLAASNDFDGNLASLGRQPLTFGNPWGKVNFAGELTGFEISLETDTAKTPVETPTPSLEEAEFTALITCYGGRDSDPIERAAEHAAQAISDAQLAAAKAQDAGDATLSAAYTNLLHGLDLSQHSDLLGALVASDTLLL